MTIRNVQRVAVATLLTLIGLGAVKAESQAPSAVAIDRYLAEPPGHAAAAGAELPPNLAALRRRLADEVRRVVEGPRLVTADGSPAESPQFAAQIWLVEQTSHRGDQGCVIS